MSERGETWAVVYHRPDGWWEAGRGWDDLTDAIEDGQTHEWGNGEWGVVKLDDVDAPRIEASSGLVFAAMFRGRA